MAVPVSYYVLISISLSGTGPTRASFGRPLLVFENSIAGSRLQGPFTSLADVTTFGFSSSSAPYAFGQAVLAQQPHVASFYIGKRLSGETLTEALDAIELAGAGAWYCTHNTLRTDAEIEELAEWTESRNKIAIAQTDAASFIGGGRSYTATIGGTAANGTYRLTFTGYGLSAPVNVDVVRSGGTPATNNDLATQMRTNLLAESDLDEVLADVTVSTNQLTITLVDAIDAGTITSSAPGGASITNVTLDTDIGALLSDAGYTRTVIVYHDDDSEFRDAAWSSRCLTYDLDVRKGAWAFKRLNGITPSNLNSVQVEAIRSRFGNYFSEHVTSSGNVVQAFTAQGWVSTGRRIDITTTLDWLTARYEEAILRLQLGETHMIGYDQAGINRVAAALQDVNARGIAAGHLLEFAVPEGEPFEGEITPLIVAPDLATISAADRTDRVLSLQSVVYLRNGIERVIFAVEARE
jgi:hypothetical protein